MQLTFLRVEQGVIERDDLITFTGEAHRLARPD